MGTKLTSEEAIKRIKETHGDTYDLSKVVYLNRRTKFEVICKTHGAFNTRLEQLERGQGCPECGLVSQGEKRRLTSLEFIARCVEVHGGRYNYSKVNYQGMASKVVIVCLEHGEFEQTPSSHLSGSGCPYCGFASQVEKRRLPLEDFISRSLNAHGDRYDYTNVDYLNSSTEVLIGCSVHGIFHQRPDFHMRGSGCPKCSIIEQHNEQRKTTEDFISDSVLIHGERYDYSNVEYLDSKTEVFITCKIHGEFSQIANNHQRGQGCPKCSLIEQANDRRFTNEDFVALAREVHGDLYDYSKVEYKSSSIEIIVICRTHGQFTPIPNNHLRGSGCPKCKSSKGELEINTILKNYNVEYFTEYKFKDLVYRSNLKCDFYLPTMNLVIEYNGEQHYQPNEFFGGMKGFIKTVERDRIKKQYCEDNGINYEVIRYDEEIKDRILEILSKY
jgi:ssDNA-binding Zn-finger/Zn-ribbon topoisomerase 1